MAEYNVKYNILVDTGKAISNLEKLEKIASKVPTIVKQLGTLKDGFKGFKDIGQEVNVVATSMANLRKEIGKVNAGLVKMRQLSGKNVNPAQPNTGGTGGTGGGTGNTKNKNKNVVARNGNNRAARGFGNGIQGLFGLADVMYAAGFPFPNMIGAAAVGMGVMSLTKSYAEYEKMMTMTKNILKSNDTSSATFDQRFQDMAKNVRAIGVETKFTATEVAGAAKYLAMAGMSIDDINNSIKPITSLAIITDAPLEQMADVVTNIQTAYGLSSEKMPQIADIMASVATNSNTTILEMGEAMKFAAPMMSMGKVSFNEAAAAIGALANAGLKGTVAGTALRAMMTRLLTPTKKGAEVLAKYNIQLYELDQATGKNRLRSLTDIFGQFSRNGASVQDMIKVFDKIGGNAANNLFAELLTLPELVQKTLNSAGSANRMADEMQNTISGKWDKVTSQFTETGMGIYETMAPVLKQGLDDLLRVLQQPGTIELFSQIATAITGLGRALVYVIDVVASNWDMFSNIFITWFAYNRMTAMAAWFQTAISGISKFGAAIKGIMALIGLSGATSAAAAGGGAAAAGGGTLLAAIGGIGTAVTLALAAIATFGLKVWANFDRANGEIENLTKQLNTLRGVAEQPIVGSGTEKPTTDNVLNQAFPIDINGYFIKGKVEEALQTKAKIEGINRTWTKVDNLLSMAPEDIIKNPKHYQYLVDEVTNPSYLAPSKLYNLKGYTTLFGDKWVATDPTRKETYKVGGKYYTRDKEIQLRSAADLMYSDIGYAAIKKEMEDSEWMVQKVREMTDMYKKNKSLAPEFTVDFIKSFTGIDIDEYASIIDPNARARKVNAAFETLRQNLKVDDKYKDKWVNKLRESLPSYLSEGVPEELLRSSKNPKLDSPDYGNPNAPDTGNSPNINSNLSGTGRVQADPTKRITFNIENLIGSFNVEYNGPEDKDKIRDLVAEAIIDAVRDSEISLMSNVSTT